MLPGLDLELESDDNGETFEDPDFSLNDDELEIETTDLQMDDPETEPDEPALAIEEDFSFEDNDFDMDEPEDDTREIEFDDEGDGIEFEPFDDMSDSLTLDNDMPVPEEEEKQDLPETDEKREQDPGIDEDEFELEFDVEDETEDDLDETSFEIETEQEPADALPFEDSSSEKKEDPELVIPSDDFSDYDAVLDQETEPEEDVPEQETLKPEAILEPEKEPEKTPGPIMAAPPKSRRKKKKPLVGGPVLILLLIFFLVIGAYLASIMTGYHIPYLSDVKIPFVEKYIKGPAPKAAEAKPVPNQKSVNGRFVTNTNAGTLFVITGRVENPSNIPYNHIQVRGTLITKGKVDAKTKDAFCGNIIAEEMLKTGNISDMNALLNIKEGNHGANVKVKPGSSVPFMVVFSDLPEKLQNFTVKVIGFENPSAGQ